MTPRKHNTHGTYTDSIGKALRSLLKQYLVLIIYNSYQYCVICSYNYLIMEGIPDAPLSDTMIPTEYMLYDSSE